MNILFLSPLFPPNAYRFCVALHERGAQVLTIGDEPPEKLPVGIAKSLAEYVFEPRMAEYAALRAAAAGLVSRHGPLHRLDSNGEHWLESEGRLRDDLHVAGLGLAATRALRSKFQMGQVFSNAGIVYPPTVRSQPPERVRELARKSGFPLVFKPDSGSGAVDTFVVRGEAELELALARALPDHVVQAFVSGGIVTFDGLTDAQGRIVFCTSHAYDAGIMQVREGKLDGHYYSLRQLPEELESVGRRAVAAFDIRERFFHLEFFARDDGSYVGLEMNIRPPGGFTTDMMSAACDFDVYDLWAALLTGEPLTDFTYSCKYHTAHAGRRSENRYRLDAAQLVTELGDILFSVQNVPDAFAATMGNVAYLLRSDNLETLKGAIALVHATR